MSEQQEKQASGDERLHRFHDGELDAGERAALEATLDDEARLKLAALGDLGAALRAAYDEPAVHFDAWPAVERGIAEAKVIPFARRLRTTAPIWLSTLAVAAAVAAVLLFPWGGGQPSNRCDVDELEVSGASATVMQLGDDSRGSTTTTVLWIEE